MTGETTRGIGAVGALFRDAARQRPQDAAIRFKSRGIWHELTWVRLWSSAVELAAGLDQLVGRRRSIAVITTADAASIRFCLGAIVAGHRLVLLSPTMLPGRLDEALLGCDAVLRQDGIELTLTARDAAGPARQVGLDELARLGRASDAATPDADVPLSCTVYTSGIDRPERMVTLTDRDAAAAPERWRRVLDRATPGDALFLPGPLADETQFLLAMSVAPALRVVVHLPEDALSVPADLRETAPELVVLPAVEWDALGRGLRVGLAPVAARAVGRGALGRLLGRRIRKLLGLDRIRHAVSYGDVLAQPTRTALAGIGVALDNVLTRTGAGPLLVDRGPGAAGEACAVLRGEPLVPGIGVSTDGRLHAAGPPLTSDLVARHGDHIEVVGRPGALVRDGHGRQVHAGVIEAWLRTSPSVGDAVVRQAGDGGLHVAVEPGLRGRRHRTRRGTVSPEVADTAVRQAALETLATHFPEFADVTVELGSGGAGEARRTWNDRRARSRAATPAGRHDHGDHADAATSSNVGAP